jgi:hypothetical protein
VRVLLLYAVQAHKALYRNRNSNITAMRLPTNFVAKCFPEVAQQQRRQQVQVCIEVDEADNATAGGRCVAIPWIIWV